VSAVARRATTDFHTQGDQASCQSVVSGSSTTIGSHEIWNPVHYSSGPLQRGSVSTQQTDVTLRDALSHIWKLFCTYRTVKLITYAAPPTATSKVLRNIQTDASLTSLPGPPTQMLDEGKICSSKWHKPRIIAMKTLGTVCQNPMHVMHVIFYFPRRQQWKLPCMLYTSAYCMQDFTVMKLSIK